MGEPYQGVPPYFYDKLGQRRENFRSLPLFLPAMLLNAAYIGK